VLTQVKIETALFIAKNKKKNVQTSTIKLYWNK